MVTPTRTNRFQSFTPLRTPSTSLRRLKTAFSPTRSHRSCSPSSSTGTTSPLTRTSSPDSHRSSGSMTSIRHLLMLRRKPSVLDIEMEEEKHLFGHEVDMLEPRPSGCGLNGGVEVGIFEVLEGRF
ncbi:hypothetical protein BU26DRAFT_557200 [Trematosphaeria pertusa]|uniref:Uncharacterized protein n=1 Tax=Trematosphaeria pertusa TaxID=390896 RepID=A0A6A6IZ42_9PLEO|nr:uncharacterized protein BU26DRAFT_557200 [Trematosphaeria pertusa]KAF2255694.1 hypothetical protein BU26DRAFT_557200 [Trematosphaeria pertusa]